MKNYFVVNTPFQYFVVTNIINSYYKNSTNIICATFPLKSDFSYATLLIISRNPLCIIQLYKLKRNLKKSFTKGNVQLFIPHLNNLLSNFFFQVSKKNKTSINVYYEGIALLYNPIVKISIKEYIKRKALSLLTGLNYVHTEQLYTNELRAVANVYTPFLSYTDWSHKKEIQFITHHELQDFDIERATLILGGPLKTKNDLENLLKNFDELLNFLNETIVTIYYKPHFETKTVFLNSIEKHFILRNKKIKIIADKFSIEELIFNYPVRTIYCFYTTSAFINLKLMYKNQLNLKVILNNNQSKNEKIITIFNDLGISIHYS